MEQAPADLCDLLKVVPLAKRETCQALRAYVREWTLVQRTYDDLDPDTSAPMDIRQVKGVKGKGKNGKGKKGKGKGKERVKNVSGMYCDVSAQNS